jgi:type IV pilus assembly protein PilA
MRRSLPQLRQHHRPAREALSSQEGFTFVELLIVILIIGVLAAIAIPNFIGQRNKGSDATAKSYIRAVATAEEAYLVEKDVYTGVLSELVAVEPTLSQVPDGTTAPTFANIGAKTFSVTATSKSGGQFTISKAASGAITRSCTGTGGGCVSGSW